MDGPPAAMHECVVWVRDHEARETDACAQGPAGSMTLFPNPFLPPPSLENYPPEKVPLATWGSGIIPRHLIP